MNTAAIIYGVLAAYCLICVIRNAVVLKHYLHANQLVSDRSLVYIGRLQTVSNTMDSETFVGKLTLWKQFWAAKERIYPPQGVAVFLLLGEWTFKSYETKLIKAIDEIEYRELPLN